MGHGCVKFWDVEFVIFGGGSRAWVTDALSFGTWNLSIWGGVLEHGSRMRFVFGAWNLSRFGGAQVSGRSPLAYPGCTAWTDGSASARVMGLLGFKLNLNPVRSLVTYTDAYDTQAHCSPRCSPNGGWVLLLVSVSTP